VTTYRLTDHETLEVVDSSPDGIEVEATFTSGGKLPPAHRHPHQRERFEILDGALRVVVEGKETVFSAGETLEIPRGIAHAMTAADGTTARVRWRTEPRLATDDLWQALTDARERAGGTPPLPVLARILRTHAAEFQLALPLGLQGPVVAALARLPAR
jgi:mannose-6-phosphate isomerase-like protein (cupin superfamily)